MISKVFLPFNIDYFCLNKKFLVYNLVSRNLKIKYRRSYLGVFWTLLAPIATACTYYFVFMVILKVKVPHYLAFVISGILPWSFFSQTVIESTESLVFNGSLITKIPIPLQVFPLTTAITNLITLLFSIPVILGAALVSEAPLTFGMLAFPLYFIFLFLFAYSFAAVFAIAFVFLRDLRHVLSIIIQLWFYGTPILYTADMVPPEYKWLIYLNPLGLIFKGIRMSLLEGKLLNLNDFGYVVASTALVVIFALLFFKKFAYKVVEIL